MRNLVLASLAAVAVAPPYAWAATLTITPDQAVYQVGDTITLDVFGDAEGGTGNDFIYGRILFDADLAEYVTSHQERLTTFNVPWQPLSLTGGSGFGEAFAQFLGHFDPPDGPLSASVTLRATAPGVLDYSWETQDLDLRLEFFGITEAEAPGGSVTIVPELSSGALLGFGAIAISIGRTRIRRR